MNTMSTATPQLATVQLSPLAASRVTRLGGALRTAPIRIAARAQSAQHGLDREAGMTTAEYAMGTVAACGFSGVLYKVVTSPTVLELIRSVITKAFKLSF